MQLCARGVRVNVTTEGSIWPGMPEFQVRVQEKQNVNKFGGGGGLGMCDALEAHISTLLLTLSSDSRHLYVFWNAFWKCTAFAKRPCTEYLDSLKNLQAIVHFRKLCRSPSWWGGIHYSCHDVQYFCTPTLFAQIMTWWPQTLTCKPWHVHMRSRGLHKLQSHILIYSVSSSCMYQVSVVAFPSCEHSWVIFEKM